jgi:hypothetical protein
MLNKRFTRLVVISNAGTNKHRALLWTCLCDCGNTVTVIGNNLRQGNSRSCGCLSVEQTKLRFTKHGMSNTNIYRTWRHMHDRCYTENNEEFKNYGGRGIAVDPSWHSFGVFFADMGDAPDGMSLDRKDNNANYSKDNCRWATPTEQSMNRRVNNRLTVNGVTQPMTAWARELNIIPNTVSHRLARGWNTEQALELIPRI